MRRLKLKKKSKQKAAKQQPPPPAATIVVAAAGTNPAKSSKTSAARTSSAVPSNDDGPAIWTGRMGTATFVVNVESPCSSTASTARADNCAAAAAACDENDLLPPALVETQRTITSSTIATVESEASLYSAAGGTAIVAKSALVVKNEEPVGPYDWGMPGYLTPSEALTLELFRDIVHSKPQSYHDAIFSFGNHEEEDYALCRWLRARKFVLDDTVKMVEEAVEERKVATLHNFYPDAKEALGVEEAVYKTQYPQVFTGGISKDGKPLFFSKPGVVNIHGLQVTSTPDGVNRYQWHCMHHTFASVLRDRVAADPTYKRYQSCVVMDLEHLSRSTVNAKVLDIIRHQSRVDALCFPEILGICVIVNAPTFFSAIWSIIRRWLDPRTAGKIEIFSFKGSAERRLKELIDADQLPSDYGGNAPSVAETIVRQGDREGRVARRVTKLMHVKAHSHVAVEVEANEEMEVVVYTRSIGGALFRVEASVLHHHHHHHSHLHVPHPRGSHREHIAEHTVRCPTERAVENAAPYSDTVARCLRGPAKYHVVGEAAHKSRLSAADHFLVVCNIYGNNEETL